MERAAAAEVAAGAGGGAAGDVQIEGSKESGQPAQQQQQPSGSEALEMPATPIPLPREIDWSEHFSFFSSVGTDGARGLTSVGMSNSESRPDSVTQQRCLENAEDERVEELTLRTCISTDARPEVSGSSSGADRPAVMRGLWGNFTRMAWRAGGDVASRENLAAARAGGDIANLRTDNAVASRENLAANLGNNLVSQSVDASSKEMPVSRGDYANADSSMPFGNQQPIPSSRPNQNEQRSEWDNAVKVSIFSNRIREQMRSKAGTPSSAVQGYPFQSVLKGKGVNYQAAREEIQLQANARTKVPMDKIPSSAHNSMARSEGMFFSGGGNVPGSQCEGTTLRELIKPGRQTMSKFEKMNLFKQILDHVDRVSCTGFNFAEFAAIVFYSFISKPSEVYGFLCYTGFITDSQTKYAHR